MSEAAPSRRGNRGARKERERERQARSQQLSSETDASQVAESKPSGNGDVEAGDKAAIVSPSALADDKSGGTNNEEDEMSDRGEVAEDKGTRDGAPGRRRGAKRETDNEQDNDDGNNNEDRFNQSASLGPLRVLEPIRQDPIKLLQQRQDKMKSLKVDRLTASNLPEIHFIGHVTSGQGLAIDSTEGVSCRWKVDVGKTWSSLGGDEFGQTQYAYPQMKETEVIPFNHPIDLHYAAAGLQGWGSPRISVQCYRMDIYGRKLMHGYGFEHIPLTPGRHRLEVCLWRPAGTPDQELDSFMLGKTPALVSHEPLYESAWRERCRLVTTAAGKVFIDIYVVTRNTDKQGVDPASAAT